MEHVHIAIILGLTAALGWGISGFFDAKASRSVHPIIASLAVNALVTVIYAVCYFAFLHDRFTLSPEAALFAASGGAVIAIGALTYFKALRIGPISLVSPTSSAYPLVTTLLAVGIFHGTIGPKQGIAIGLIVVGIMLVTDFWRLITKRKTVSRGPVLGLVTAACWGVGYVLVAQSVQQAGWQQATLVELVAMMLAFGVCIPFLESRHVVTPTALGSALRNRNVLLAGTIAFVAALSFNIGFSYDATGGAIVATLSAFYPILTVLLALRHFEEPVGRMQLFGAAISIIGIVLLAA